MLVKRNESRKLKRGITKEGMKTKEIEESKRTGRRKERRRAEKKIEKQSRKEQMREQE